MKTYTVSMYKSKLPPVIVEADEEQCPYCVCAYKTVKWRRPGDVSFLVIDGHIHGIECVEISPILVLTCTCVSSDDADKLIAECMSN